MPMITRSMSACSNPIEKYSNPTSSQWLLRFDSDFDTSYMKHVMVSHLNLTCVHVYTCFDKAAIALDELDPLAIRCKFAILNFSSPVNRWQVSRLAYKAAGKRYQLKPFRCLKDFYQYSLRLGPKCTRSENTVVIDEAPHTIFNLEF